jgi:uncharacterized membrane protein
VAHHLSIYGSWHGGCAQIANILADLEKHQARSVRISIVAEDMICVFLMYISLRVEIMSKKWDFVSSEHDGSGQVQT